MTASNPHYTNLRNTLTQIHLTLYTINFPAKVEFSPSPYIQIFCSMSQSLIDIIK